MQERLPEKSRRKTLTFYCGKAEKRGNSPGAKRLLCRKGLFMSVVTRTMGILAFVSLLFGCSNQMAQRDTLYQISTIDALLDGVYDGHLTTGELVEHGDLGIGTFNALEGEMICLDGKVYQALANGEVRLVPPEEPTPFAAVTFFEADSTFQIEDAATLDALYAQLDSWRKSDNVFYAIRLKGTFDVIRARSVPRQEKPYPPLSEVVQTQAVFHYEKIEGEILGFWCPAFVKSVNVTGYHLHFLSADRKKGGHLLDCRIARAEGALDETYAFRLDLPQNAAFHDADLTRDREAELRQVE